MQQIAVKRCDLIPVAVVAPGNHKHLHLRHLMSCLWSLMSPCFVLITVQVMFDFLMGFTASIGKDSKINDSMVV